MQQTETWAIGLAFFVPFLLRWGNCSLNGALRIFSSV